MEGKIQSVNGKFLSGIYGPINYLHRGEEAQITLIIILIIEGR